MQKKNNKRMNKLLLPILMLILVFGLLSACGNKVETPSGSEKLPEETPVETPNPNEESAEIAAFPVTVTDAAGNDITIEKQPERIVSLMPSNTEVMYALGMGDAVVGVNDFDNYPPEVIEKEKIGSMPINIEKIVSLNPDVILAHASYTEGVDQLKDAGLKVVVIHDASSISGVYDSIELIAKTIGAEEKGIQIIEEMRATFAEYASKASAISQEERALVWVEVDPMLFTTGNGTFMNEMLELLNAKNAAGDQEGWAQFTEEEVINLNPDVIITTYGDYVEDPVQLVNERQSWQEVNAVVNKRVYDVDADAVTRSGPRLMKGIEELAKVIYPEVFAK